MDKFINREVSWLAFNERVLQEANDKSVPVIERLRFLGIFSNNLDEFFRVRVASIRRMKEIGYDKKNKINNPQKTLEEIHSIVVKQNHQFQIIFDDIKKILAENGIQIIDETKVTDAQKKYLANYFFENIRPTLVPIMLHQLVSFPELKDRNIYLAIKLSNSLTIKKEYALVEIPTDNLPRFIEIPSTTKNKYIILLDDIIRLHLKDIFKQFDYEKIEAYTIKITRDAELDIDHDIAQSFIEKITKSVKNRKKGRPVRMVYDKQIAPDLLKYITTKTKLKVSENLIAGGRYHNFKDFIGFPDLGKKELVNSAITNAVHPLLNNNNSVLKTIESKDVLLHFPYQSFSHIIDMLREAAIDPFVKTIKITLYRVAQQSNIINALVNAVKNGKKVIAVVEVQARFDEEANIKWASLLQEEGVTVIYGIPNLKVHAKLCLIEREEKKTIKKYCLISTGNFNEKTAKIYADNALLTTNKIISQEVAAMFLYLERNLQFPTLKKLIASPVYTRKKFLTLIDNEIAAAKKKKKAGIFLKLNSLVDEVLIQKLYEASKAGVPIKIIVRGICALKPGVKKLSENIEVISIVDKFLEHSRIYVFENKGERLLYISSADWMSRNLDVRIEISCPILDKKLQDELLTMLQIQWSDTQKARIIDAELGNLYRNGQPVIRSQEAILDYLSENK